MECSLTGCGRRRRFRPKRPPLYRWGSFPTLRSPGFRQLRPTGSLGFGPGWLRGVCSAAGAQTMAPRESRLASAVCTSCCRSCSERDPSHSRAWPTLRGTAASVPVAEGLAGPRAPTTPAKCVADDDEVVPHGIETATFRGLMRFPGTEICQRIEAEARLCHRHWNLYDARLVVFRCRGVSGEEPEPDYWRAYREIYRWGSVFHGALSQNHPAAVLRHFAYVAGWKKFEPRWDWVIRSRQVSRMRPVLEQVLRGFGREAEQVEFRSDGAGSHQRATGRREAA